MSNSAVVLRPQESPPECHDSSPRREGRGKSFYKYGMGPELVAGERVSAAIARAFEAELQSNVYAVLRLKREVDGVRGDRSIYTAEAVNFMARLAKRVRGKRVYERLPHLERFLPNAMSIEQLVEGPHFNLMIRRPDSWDFEPFEEAVRQEWQKSFWASDEDERAVKIEARQPGSRLFGYCHKEGDEALIVETLRFATLAVGPNRARKQN